MISYTCSCCSRISSEQGNLHNQCSRTDTHLCSSFCIDLKHACIVSCFLWHAQGGLSAGESRHTFEASALSTEIRILAAVRKAS